MDKLSNLEYERRAAESKKYAEELRANPRDWFLYYVERGFCVLILLAIAVVGFLAFAQLLSGSSG